MANNMLAKYTLYRHTFPNGKIYIGITKQKPEVRWGKNGRNYEGNSLLWKAILKYGWENIKHEILYTNLTEEQANELEIDLINQYKATDRNFGYNIWPGGLVSSGWHHSEETKQKLSKMFSGKKYLNRRSNKGQRFGRVTVYQYDLDGNFIKDFNGYWEASRAIGIPTCGISDCANGTCKTYYGFTFSKEKLTKEEVLAKIKYDYGRVIIYCYDRTGELLNTFKSYREVYEAIPNVIEGNLSDCLNGRLRTYRGYVFSKVELTKEEVQARYQNKPRKARYKIILIDKNTEEKIVYNSVEDLAKVLDVKVTVLRNVVNGARSKLHKQYIFIKEPNNAN
jgi:group I intron endonuclease